MSKVGSLVPVRATPTRSTICWVAWLMPSLEIFGASSTTSFVRQYSALVSEDIFITFLARGKVGLLGLCGVENLLRRTSSRPCDLLPRSFLWSERLNSLRAYLYLGPLPVDFACVTQSKNSLRANISSSLSFGILIFLPTKRLLRLQRLPLLSIIMSDKVGSWKDFPKGRVCCRVRNEDIWYWMVLTDNVDDFRRTDFCACR